MKIKTELCPDGEDEIIIKCRSKTEQIRKIESVLEELVASDREMVLFLAGAEYYVPINEILFFESGNGHVYAHTKDKMFTSEYKLFELEDILPKSFLRISKSTVANVMLIASLRRELVGNGEITFKGSDKKTYFSRVYYKILKDKIDEMRLRK